MKLLIVAVSKFYDIIIIALCLLLLFLLLVLLLVFCILLLLLLFLLFLAPLLLSSPLLIYLKYYDCFDYYSAVVVWVANKGVYLGSICLHKIIIIKKVFQAYSVLGIVWAMHRMNIP